MIKKVAIYAHRGASAYVLENTLEAFEKAISQGADGIEIDVQRSKDGQLFVYHDLNLQRLTGLNKLITDCTAGEVASLSVGKPFLRAFSVKRIPSFEHILQWAIEKNIPLNIEIKESLVGHMKSFLALLYKYPLPVGSHISSFQEEVLVEIKQQLPFVETALIITKKFDWANLPYMQHINAIHAHKKYYNRRYLKMLEEAKKPARFYSIDGHESFLKDPHPTVVGWITDYPDRVVKIEKSRH